MKLRPDFFFAVILPLFVYTCGTAQKIDTTNVYFGNQQMIHTPGSTSPENILKVENGVEFQPATINIISNDPVFVQFNCEKWQSFTDWEEQNNVHQKCADEHQWVYAEPRDVNPEDFIERAVYCPCGCGGSEKEARICRKCKLHQQRVRSWGYTQKARVSEYQKLLNEIQKN